MKLKTKPVKSAKPKSETKPDTASVGETAIQSDEPAEDQFWAELKLMSAIAEIERERVEIESEIEQFKESVSSRQTALKEAESELADARDEHKERTEELLSLARKLVHSVEGKTLPETDETAVPAGWRALSTKRLLAGVKGFTAKKLETLVELAADVGGLEDLRGEASKSNKEFHEVLPKGFGKTVAQTIEDKLVEHIAKYQMEQVNPERQKLADDLLAEIRGLAEESRWTPADCLPKQADSEDMHAGYTAFGQGQSHASFLSEDRMRARDWMIGWVSGEIIKEAEAETDAA